MPIISVRDLVVEYDGRRVLKEKRAAGLIPAEARDAIDEGREN